MIMHVRTLRKRKKNLPGEKYITYMYNNKLDMYHKQLYNKPTL